LSRRLPVIFPVHPRTRQRIQSERLAQSGLILLPPLSYLDFLHLMSEARIVLTDSGGIQEETTILQVPCLTLRNNTERPVTIEQGTHRLVGGDGSRILPAAISAWDQEVPKVAAPELWDGCASRRIVDVLQEALGPAVTQG